ncbi:S8 family serine peptidase [Paenibacillus koleovorans]|uniref:S8 family serine peptidase n=1 Tax=Paenibacillus koleovorans TaxID=121608 RepID=UPI001FE9B8CA|nr:S8 family serine peptidase [Paenibacillus koleovorans]
MIDPAKFRWVLLLALVVLLATGLLPPAPPLAAPQLVQADDLSNSTWLMKWSGAPPEAFLRTSHIVSHNPETGIWVAGPGEGVDAFEWREHWRHAEGVDYMTTNQTVRLSAVKPNDPFVSRQKYLEQIHAEEAWAVSVGNESLIIALVDTGVDLDHPDLKDNLVPGINLIQRNAPPQDDNGHGTSVAGVLGAVGNNNKGISGVLWKARIMPIKALGAKGVGDEDKLGEGIRYAVDHGAKIVVLSVGLLRNDPYLEEIVDYAEKKDVLLVAATGNDEGEHVRYPAAYPTVLGVGGLRTDNLVEYRSNYGNEVDLVAAWSVYTTAPGGKYVYNEGSSMAAPQVAAAAALAWSRNPGMKVHELRNLLRQTAQDVAEPGWDNHTGYGLLRVDRAVNQLYVEDMYEPNDTVAAAKPFPLNQMVMGELRGGRDVDWFTLHIPYDGTIKLDVRSELPAPAGTQLLHLGPNQTTPDIFAADSSSMLELQVQRGTHWFALQQTNNSAASRWKYRFTNTFRIGPDAFEDNDRSFKAFRLAPRSQTISGTFDHDGDEDWFTVTMTQSGTMSLRVSVDTKRIDLVLKVQKRGESITTIDSNGDGEPEEYRFEAFPGTYYFAVDKTSPRALAGTYTVDLRIEAKLLDPNEPNDKSFQASSLGNRYPLEGVLDRSDGLPDIDWFRISIAEESLLRLGLSQIPTDRRIRMELYSGALSEITNRENALGVSSMEIVQRVIPGTYFVRLTSDANFRSQMYRLEAQVDRLVEGYTDISGHWAEASIVDLTRRMIFQGYGDFAFYPEQSITRAEAVATLVRTFGYTKQKSISYPDLLPAHWAYNAVSLAAQAGLTSGYPDGTFQPDRPLNRVEMTVLLANALGIVGKQRGNMPFSDVDDNYWATPILKQMKMEGWITGYEDGSFRPETLSTRAEFATLLARVIAN